MLPESIRSLILDEQTRTGDRFVEGVDLADYMEKLGERAEIVSDVTTDRCRGFVAFYCNDQATRQAYITLALVNPLDRGHGIGRALVTRVIETARLRGFTACRLEVATHNPDAEAFYVALGFRRVGGRGHKHLLEIGL